MDEKLTPSHGGFRDLAAYRMLEIVHDANVDFAGLYVSRVERLYRVRSTWRRVV